MGSVGKAPVVKRFCGILYRLEDDAEEAVRLLVETWGPTDLSAGPFPFTATDYYAGEMGAGLLRRFVSFEHVVPAEAMAEWKTLTNSLEESFSDGGKRRVNLDPGFLDLAKVVLLSTKDFSHRIHLGRGIYAEVTLLYRDGGLAFLPWTYPDYRSPEYLAFFLSMRRKFRTQKPDGGECDGNS